MTIEFEIGDPQKPLGHAMAYFRLLGEQEKVLATYVVVLPVTVDFAKYVPPFLASQLDNFPLKNASAFSLPPVPEEVESYEQLRRITELREDDLIFGGTLNSADLTEVMQRSSDLVQEYNQLWQNYSRSAIPAPQEKEERTFAVNEVLYSLMNERDRLSELSKMVGKLRFALSGDDSTMADEVEEEIRALAKHLPAHFQVEQILQAARDLSSKGEQLAQLCLERCYKLAGGETESVADLEEKIKALEGPS